MNEGMHKKPKEKKVASLGGIVVIFGFCMCRPSATIKKNIVIHSYLSLYIGPMMD